MHLAGSWPWNLRRKRLCGDVKSIEVVFEKGVVYEIIGVGLNGQEFIDKLLVFYKKLHSSNPPQAQYFLHQGDRIVFSSDIIIGIIQRIHIDPFGKFIYTSVDFLLGIPHIVIYLMPRKMESITVLGAALKLADGIELCDH